MAMLDLSRISHILSTAIERWRDNYGWSTKPPFITSRGNARAVIYLDDEDRTRFLEVLGHEVGPQRCRSYAYCLMDNHYHLFVETREPNLSKGMRRLNQVYTQAFNRRHGRVGHVLQGRYKAIIVDKDNYLLELCRYIVLNPVRAGMVKTEKD